MNTHYFFLGRCFSLKKTPGGHAGGLSKGADFNKRIWALWAPGALGPLLRPKLLLRPRLLLRPKLLLRPRLLLRPPPFASPPACPPGVFFREKQRPNTKKLVFIEKMKYFCIFLLFWPMLT